MITADCEHGELVSCELHLGETLAKGPVFWPPAVTWIGEDEETPRNSSGWEATTGVTRTALEVAVSDLVDELFATAVADDYTAEQLARDCSFCGSGPDQLCMTASGYFRGPHAVRVGEPAPPGVIKAKFSGSCSLCSSPITVGEPLHPVFDPQARKPRFTCQRCGDPDNPPPFGPLRLPCPYCNAAVGDFCMTASGLPAYAHSGRNVSVSGA